MKKQNRSLIFTAIVILYICFFFNDVSTRDELDFMQCEDESYPDESYPDENEVPTCGIPAAPNNGHVKCDNTEEKSNVASECTFHCNKGYYLEGKKSRGSEGDINSEKITCKENGEWTSKVPKCNLYLCKKPLEVSNGKYTCTNNGKIGFSHKCTLTCEKYYKEQPNNYLVCGFKKQWIGVLPKCERVLCSKPNPPKNGRAKCTSTNIANKYSSCILSCENQYKMLNEKDDKDELTIQCYLDSKGGPSWDNFPSECISNPLCNIPEVPMNGYVKCNDSKVKPNLAHQCVYHCNKGNYFKGSKDKNNAMIIKCLGNDKWNFSLLPKCISAPCKKPNFEWPLDGKCNDHHCKLWCVPGYQLEGKNKMDCFNEEWSEIMSTCQNPSKFPILPQLCKEKKVQFVSCRSFATTLNKTSNILKIFAEKCYDWMELYENHKDYIQAQYNLEKNEFSKIKRNNKTMDCILVTDIVGKYDGKSNCDELCRRTFVQKNYKIPLDGYNVGNINVTRTCICVTKHLYKYKRQG